MKPEVDLCEKYRPRRFVEVIGQERVVESVVKLVRSGKATGSHYLFSGAYGCGKTSLGRVLAKALMCPSKVGEVDGCGVCPICLSIDRGGGTDYSEINAASQRGIDDVRGWANESQFLPMGGSNFKVYLVDESHKLTKEANEALLKLLESDIPSIFIFLTTEPEKMKATLKDRLSKFELSLVDEDKILAMLVRIVKEENLEFEMKALELIARSARGHVRTAVKLLSTHQEELKYEVLRWKVGEPEEIEAKGLLEAIQKGTIDEFLKSLSEKKKATGEVEAFYLNLAEGLMDYCAKAYMGWLDRIGFGQGELKSIFMTARELEREFRIGGRQWIILAFALQELADAKREGVLGSKAFFVNVQRKIEGRSSSNTEELRKLRDLGGVK